MHVFECFLLYETILYDKRFTILRNVITTIARAGKLKEKGLNIFNTAKISSSYNSCIRHNPWANHSSNYRPSTNKYHSSIMYLQIFKINMF